MSATVAAGHRRNAVESNAYVHIAASEASEAIEDVTT